MSKIYKDLLIIIASVLGLTLIVWMPFIMKANLYNFNLQQGFATIYRNFDGLEYVVIAKTFYQPALTSQYPLNLPASYYPAHFPGYSMLISIFAPIFGYLKSMLGVTLLFTILSAVAFYFLAKDLKLTSQPLWLTIIFLVLPARWLIVHSVGSPEPIFIFFTIISIYFFIKFQDMNQKGYIWLAALAGSLAQITRPPGILLFFTFCVYLLYIYIKSPQPAYLWQLIKRNYPILLIPLALLSVFICYQIQLGNFWAYFQTGDNIHLTFPPYQVFNKAQAWVGDIWLEDIVYIFLLGFLAGLMLLKDKLMVAGIFILTYLTASIFVAHRDISRYVMPIYPFAIIAFEKILTTKQFKIALIIIALGIYLYTINFLNSNTAPIAELFYFD